MLLGNDNQFRREGLQISLDRRGAFEGGGMVEAEDVPLKLAPPPLPGRGMEAGCVNLPPPLFLLPTAPPANLGPLAANIDDGEILRDEVQEVARCRLPLLGDDLERSISFEADDREVASVESENRPDVLAFGKVSQGGVGELKPGVLAAEDDGGDGRQIFRVERKQGEETPAEATAKILKKDGPLAKKPGGFGDNRPTGEERLLDGEERISTT